MAKGEGGGAPRGNQNASKGAQLTAAFHAALKRMDRELQEATGDKSRSALVDICYKVAEKASEGDLVATNILFDRIAGKPKQQTELTGEDGGPIQHGIVISFVTPNESKG